MQRTPLYDEHRSGGGKIVDFHGWELPVQYQGILAEHLHTRTQASLFDCSHMGEFEIRGAAAIKAYDRLVCSDIRKLAAGRARYGFILNEQAGIIDDIITMRLGENELFVVTNAGPLEQVSNLIREACPDARDSSAATAKIDVQGPLSREILLREGLEAAARLRYFQACRAEWGTVSIILSRTGYTGELGFEIFLPNDAAPALWRAFLRHEEVRPAGLGARDTLRTEMGYPLSGQDFDSHTGPLELMMEGFVAWDTDFAGRDALLTRRDQGGYPRFVGLRACDRRAPRHGYDIFEADVPVGAVTSGTYGPSVGCGVGLGYLPERLAKPGVTIEAGPKRMPLEAVELPFYRNGTCRN